MSLTVIVGGIFIVTGQQQVMTTRDLDTKNNHTHLTLNKRLVPHSHNTSHQSLVSSQVNTSHIQLPYNNSLTQGLTGNRTSRVKRRLPLKVLLGLVKVTGAVAPIVQVIKDQTTTSEITIPDTPTKHWIQAYNDTHHFQVNYTHKNMVKIPEQKVNITELGFSDDPYDATLLYNWYNRKYSRCRHYKNFLGKCHDQDLVSEDQEDTTSLVELLRQVGWWDQTRKVLERNIKDGMLSKYMLTKDRCRMFNRLVNI